MGKGTYGSKVGRPAKKKTKAKAKPKKNTMRMGKSTRLLNINPLSTRQVIIITLHTVKTY